MWVRVFFYFHTGDEIACNKGHRGPMHCVHFSPGGESYTSRSKDGTIRIWQTGPLIHDNIESVAANGSIGKKANREKEKEREGKKESGRKEKGKKKFAPKSPMCQHARLEK
ncbi:hypothetical protein CRYUN_Cryun17cG0064000 [Craigia yunnanensis]